MAVALVSGDRHDARSSVKSLNLLQQQLLLLPRLMDYKQVVR